jgi:hypothetical protein
MFVVALRTVVRLRGWSGDLNQASMGTGYGNLTSWGALQDGVSEQGRFLNTPLGYWRHWCAVLAWFWLFNYDIALTTHEPR